MSFEKFMLNNISAFIFISILCSGCASTSSSGRTLSSLELYPSGIYHTAARNETLWSIAKAYDVDINCIVDANGINNPSLIRQGQDIFIPGAKKHITASPVVSPGRVSKTGYVWPVYGGVISYFGSIANHVKNKGIDIAADHNSPVVASRAGRVVFSDDKVKGMGKTLIIDHGDGYSTLYAYNTENLVCSGENVRQSQVIARSGCSARSRRPSLHFQVRKGHEPVNPYYYLP
ncbi:MAG: LysM peptidoglycan-binding domain-containing M23 family metallopeptidase [Candidatus Omnitrophica bacterium]|jgi:murein DD-endopeptidase MepM/ murein hydrolase activator NlpD|nr:LysM peptidoglycan-binding domain-containing M23 family metallopeptidase [Candidatus Omnitrophota bacterium]